VCFAGVAGRSRAPKNARSSSLNRASAAAHVMLCSWVRILGAPIFKIGEYLTFEYSLEESRRLRSWVLRVWSGWSSFFCASWLATVTYEASVRGRVGRRVSVHLGSNGRCHWRQGHAGCECPRGSITHSFCPRRIRTCVHSARAAFYVCGGECTFDGIWETRLEVFVRSCWQSCWPTAQVQIKGSEPCSNWTDCQSFPDPRLPHTLVFLSSRRMCH
jgi:hypothetical protein